MGIKARAAAVAAIAGAVMMLGAGVAAAADEPGRVGGDGRQSAHSQEDAKQEQHGKGQGENGHCGGCSSLLNVIDIDIVFGNSSCAHH
ncbi:hypothetical protein [Streptomyces erythrochromogenes]|uniref:hypothetical protein n=1 Tax=Streptomyces erythrochromogenes TaxID=285574 RepID=UPI003684C6F3